MEFVTGVKKKETLELSELLEEGRIGTEVKVNGAIHTIRDMGTIAFIILRKREGLVQCVYEEDISKFDLKDVKEADTVEVTGVLVESAKAPNGIEIRLGELKILSEPAEPMPLPIAKWKLNTSLEAKLNYRPISLRNIRERAKFRIQEGIVRGFRDFLYKEGFTEIHTPKIGAKSAEGGANLFRLEYFHRPAILQQSPQFYKQMMVGVFDRVFETAPVFRAEKHNTKRHLNEYTSLDFEMGYIDGFEDIMAMETGFLQYTMTLLEKEYARELKILNIQVPKTKEIPAVRFDEIKKHVAIPVATIGGLNDPAQMEQIIAEGKADIVYMARALLADPFLPRKVMENRDEEIVKCLRCFTCMAERAATSTRRCTVNPLIGREMEGDEVQLAPVRKKVLVAGGGPGGLYAAYTAARRGHQVILCEKEDTVGGILKSEQALPFKHEMYELAGTYELLARKAGVEIRTSTPVTKEYAEKENADALIIAAGSRPLVPPIPGLNGENVVIVNNYYKEKEKVGDEVVVFGGGLAGCECAIHLGMEGKKVRIVEMRDVLAPDANVRHRPLLLKEIDKYAEVYTGYKGLEVTEEGVWCEDKEGKKVLVPGNTIICALGQRSRTDIVDELRDCAPYVAVIGDVSRVSTITNAVYWGYHAALDI